MRACRGRAAGRPRRRDPALGADGRARGGRTRMRWRVVHVLVVAVLVFSAAAWAEDPVAYVTEIQRDGTGGAFVRLAAGDGQFHPAQPLLALRRGDEIRVSGNGQVVLLYHAGSGTRRITRADSP